MSLRQEIFNVFHQGSLLKKLLFINIGVFVIVQIVLIILKLMRLDSFDWMPYAALPSNIGTMLVHPWTLLSYMFLHTNFFHILFNLLCLYWFGTIFLYFLSPKQLLAVYIFGGLTGALFFIGGYNIFPYFDTLKENSILLGASASIIAIMVAVATYSPDFEVQLFLLGRVKLKYIALFIFVMSLVGISSTQAGSGATENIGGQLAHIGGALAGFIFARQLRYGKDITKGFNNLVDKFMALFKRKPVKFKVVQSSRPKTDDEFLRERKVNEVELNNILDKIKQSGYSSLSKSEKEWLFSQSNSNK